MKRWLWRVAFALAVVILALTVVNASWLAPMPRGGPKLLAHRGVYQQFPREGVGRHTCTADRIEPPVHDLQENTVRSMQAARRLSAQMVELDIAPTADDRIAVFHDWTLDCRTDGTGETRDCEQQDAAQAGLERRRGGRAKVMQRPDRRLGQAPPGMTV